MKKTLARALMFVLALPAFCQSPTPLKYEPATIMNVMTHPQRTGANSSVTGYDISLRVGKTLYKVLYMPPSGAYGAQYSAGDEILVLVGSKTITFNDILGNSRKLPIMSRTTAAAVSK